MKLPITANAMLGGYDILDADGDSVCTMWCNPSEKERTRINADLIENVMNAMAAVKRWHQASDALDNGSGTNREVDNAFNAMLDILSELKLDKLSSNANTETVTPDTEPTEENNCPCRLCKE